MANNTATMASATRVVSSALIRVVMFFAPAGVAYVCGPMLTERHTRSNPSLKLVRFTNKGGASEQEHCRFPIAPWKATKATPVSRTGTLVEGTPRSAARPPTPLLTFRGAGAWGPRSWDRVLHSARCARAQPRWLPSNGACAPQKIAQPRARIALLVSSRESPPLGHDAQLPHAEAALQALPHWNESFHIGRIGGPLFGTGSDSPHDRARLPPPSASTLANGLPSAHDSQGSRFPCPQSK
jgi:hypothetical protein